MEIRKRFTFEAAHSLPNHPGKCARMHGHSYRLEVAIAGPLHRDGPARGMVEDFDSLDDVVRTHVLDELDHRTLNETIDNPTAEEIVLWIWRRLEPLLTSLEEIVLWETPDACAVLRRDDTPMS
ncbi:MAG: 6-carboxytetrahydropterin synthase QueD [Candidatus Tyrphobacter sp.]